MFRPMMIASLLATSAVSAAQAQTAGGPPIAYIKAGSAHEIYLTNETGSSVTRVYAAPRKTTLRWVDIRPGGNELAFNENLAIKIQKFHDNGQPNGAATGVRGAPCSITQSPDYHPSGDGRLVFIAACGFGNFQIMTYVAGDAAPTPLFTVGSANRVRWSRTGEHLYYDEALSRTDATSRLRRRNLATGEVTDFGTISDVSSFDVARTGDRLVFGSALAPKLFDAGTMTDTSQSLPACGGDDIHFSPDDAKIIYETPPSSKGTFVLVKASNCSGSTTSITGKGEWNHKDWRPNGVAAGEVVGIVE